jgi:site-specific recombinase XerD
VYDVKEILGHEDLKTTQKYTDEWSAGRMTDALRKNRDD